MQALMAQLPALLGVMIGVVATYLATVAGERVRWRRHQNARWDEARMRAYTEYGNAVKRVIQVSCELAVARGIINSAEPVDLREGLRELKTATSERAAKWETVLLLGEAATVAAARAWHEGVWRLEWFARGKLKGQDEWDEALRDLDDARQRFYAQARLDLGVTGGKLPPSSWPPKWLVNAQIDVEQPTEQPSRRTMTDDHEHRDHSRPGRRCRNQAAGNDS